MEVYLLAFDRCFKRWYGDCFGQSCLDVPLRAYFCGETSRCNHAHHPGCSTVAVSLTASYWVMLLRKPTDKKSLRIGFCGQFTRGYGSPTL